MKHYTLFGAWGKGFREIFAKKTGKIFMYKAPSFDILEEKGDDYVIID